MPSPVSFIKITMGVLLLVIIIFIGFVYYIPKGAELRPPIDNRTGVIDTAAMNLVKENLHKCIDNNSNPDFSCISFISDNVSFCDSSEKCIGQYYLLNALFSSEIYFCDKIVGGDNLSYDVSYFCKAVVKRDPKLCDNCNGDVKNYCSSTILALSSSNVSLCNNSKKCFLFYYLLRGYESGNPDYCYELAKDDNERGLCLAILNRAVGWCSEEYTENCYDVYHLKLFLASGNISYCNKVDNRDVKELCMILAEHLNDAKSCDLDYFQNTGLYLFKLKSCLAMKLIDISFCNNMGNSEETDDCYYDLALRVSNSTFCEGITNSETKVACHEDVKG